MKDTKAYTEIKENIALLKKNYPILKDKSDDYIFSALCIKSCYYKNPDYNWEYDIEDIIVDGKGDGGVDAILLDPSDEDILILVQSKYYKKIQPEKIKEALEKLIKFYRNMCQGDYHSANSTVQSRFLTLNAELSEKAKIKFVFYVSVDKNQKTKESIEDSINNYIKQLFPTYKNLEVLILYAKDIVKEIRECEGSSAIVENGKIIIDRPNNILRYKEKAIIVNVSAFSIKTLYAIHNLKLLSKNLRYYIKPTKATSSIDSSINETIDKDSQLFWLRNNGITIICDNFESDGNKITLYNFSIVNGGQTTYLIYKNRKITQEQDFYLPCKIICASGDTPEEKNQFILDIAVATNSQKPIKEADLKANAPEQIHFADIMKEVGVYYQTKRGDGEKIPKKYKKTNLEKVGKLCIASLFQLPATSRNKSDAIYNDKFYNVVFNGNQKQLAMLIKDLLYVDTCFQEYIKIFKQDEDKREYISFASVSKSFCIAFVAFMARYMNGNFTSEEKDEILSCYANLDKYSSAFYDKYLYRIFSNLKDMKTLFSQSLVDNKEVFDKFLIEMFDLYIIVGSRYYKAERRNGQRNKSRKVLSETNFIKQDENYYAILDNDWFDTLNKVKEIYKKYDCL